ncbi:MAG: cation diffusion facilitator family transporter, partial [Bacilli bacterium]|nr:cation diffusion facilitator family transporter [Bacilli bacterium]
MERFLVVKKASILGVIGNIFLLIIKAIAAILTNSQAMMSDALNSTGDIISSFMTYVGNKIASKGPDEDHNLGHGKAEYIFSMLISLTMIILSIKMLYSSIKSLFTSYSYTFSIYLIIVCIITIITKLFLFIYTNSIAKKYDNLLIRANSYDHRNDCLLTTLNLIAAILGQFGITYVDGLVGIILSLWIIITGMRIFKESYDVLMDKGLDKQTKDKIDEIVKKYPEITKTNHFNSTPVGYQYQISLTIFVDGNLSTFESHNIANSLEKEITKLDEVFLAVIHVNPTQIKK